MKNNLKLLLGMILIISGIAQAQVGIGTTSPNASAALDITSTTKGLLIPRMTTTERTAIVSPAIGLQVYDATTNTGWYYNGTKWVEGVSGTNAKFTNVPASTRTDLSTLSDGVTARPTANAFTIKDNGFVGIGNIAPTEKIEVTGNIKGDRLLAYGAGGFNSNTAIGTNSLANVSNTGANNIAIGLSTLLLNSTGEYNIAIGTYSSEKNTSGYSNVAIGSYNSGNNTTGFSNVSVGVQASAANTTGSNNCVLGRSALINNTTGSGNIVFGSSAGSFNADYTSTTTMNDSVLIGASASSNGNNQTNQIAIGKSVVGLGSNTVVIGNDSIITTALKGNVGIGTTTPTAKLEVAGAIKVGYDASGSSTAGMIRFNTTNSKFEGYDGTAWQTLN